MNYVNPRRISLHQAPEDRPFLWLPDIVQFLRRRWKSIVATLVAILAITCLYIATATPKYTATAELLIDAQRADPFKQIPITIGDASAESALVDSQVEILRSHSLSERVVRRLNLANDSEFRSFGKSLVGTVMGSFDGLFASASQPAEPDQAVEAAVRTLSRLFDIRRLGLSYVLEVEVRTPSAARSAEIANALADQYLEEQLESKRNTAEKAKTWLMDGIASVRDRAMAADNAVQAFRVDNQIVNIDRLTITEQKMSELNTALTAAHNRVAEARARSQQIDAILHLGIGDASVSDAIQNVVIIRLRQQYLDASKRMTELSNRYGAGHIAVLRAKQDMESLQASGFSELERIAQSYRSDLAVAEAADVSAQQNYDAQMKRAVDANKVRAELRDLESSADIYRTLYQNFLQRYTQALQDQSFPVPQARVFTVASAPLKASSPNIPLLLGGGTVLGLVAGLVVGFIREELDRGLHVPSDVSKLLDLDCIALMPRSKAAMPRTWQFAAGLPPVPSGTAKIGVASSATPPGFGEALHAIRARLAGYKAQTEQAKIIGLTSAVAGEGKTTVAVNLAQLLAECGNRTLLLDWDLRSIALTKRLLPECDRGIETLVAGGSVDVDRLIHVDQASGLHILPAGRARPGIDAGKILGSRQVATMLAELRQRYDYIVVDLPAILPCVDSQLIWHLIDEFIFVIEWAATNRELVEECLSRGYLDRDSIVGVVLNKVDPKILRRYA